MNKHYVAQFLKKLPVHVLLLNNLQNPFKHFIRNIKFLVFSAQTQDHLRAMLKKLALNFKPDIGKSRFLSNLSVKHKENVEDKMQAWQIHSYGGLEELKLSNIRVPVIARPTDVLIKVQASSVNPIDIAMTSTQYLILILLFHYLFFHRIFCTRRIRRCNFKFHEKGKKS